MITNVQANQIRYGVNAFSIHNHSSEKTLALMYTASFAKDVKWKSHNFLAELEGNLVLISPNHTKKTVIYEEQKGITFNKFIASRFNLLRKSQINDRLSIYYGGSLFLTSFSEYHTIEQYGEYTLSESTKYKKLVFGLKTQFDFKLFSIKKFALHAYIHPYNYYFNLGNETDLGLKLVYSE
ncbi:hypothetical protein [Marinicellulosiphila megalodicopiae]|uniref:hypothetical protein n=1 Tax=Marinicellulosiphila megalodicopiae TaxID=2724896 RepID=UPI003BB0D213